MTASGVAASMVLMAGLALAPGGLDPSWSDDGVVLVDLGSRYDAVGGVAVMDDGRVVVSGANGRSGAVLRFRADGNPDRSFGGNGRVVDAYGVRMFYEDLAVAADGSVVVAGWGVTARSTAWDAFVARYRPDGSPDPAFGGGDGRVDLHAGGDEWATAVALQDDGRIVVAGAARRDDSGMDALVARFTPSGEPDESFGDDGVVTTPWDEGHSFASDVVVLDDARIVASGWLGGMPYGAVAAYLPSGPLDPDFGAGGVATVGVTSPQTVLWGLARRGDGVVAAGATAGNTMVIVAALTGDGSPDRSFSRDGEASVGLGPGEDIGKEVAVQEDGRIVVVASDGVPTGSNLAAVRLLPDGVLDPAFGRDGIASATFGEYDVPYGMALGAGTMIVASTATTSGWRDMAVARFLLD